MNNLDDDKFNHRWWLNPMDSKQLTNRDRQNVKSFNHWILIWGVAFFGVIWFIKPIRGNLDATPIWYFLIAFSPIVATLFLIRAFVRFYRQTNDEYIQKLNVESLAIGFAVAFFMGICFEVLEAVFVPTEIPVGLVNVGLVLGYFISYVVLCRKNNV